MRRYFPMPCLRAHNIHVQSQLTDDRREVRKMAYPCVTEPLLVRYLLMKTAATLRYHLCFLSFKPVHSCLFPTSVNIISYPPGIIRATDQLFWKCTPLHPFQMALQCALRRTAVPNTPSAFYPRSLTLLQQKIRLTFLAWLQNPKMHHKVSLPSRLPSSVMQ